MIQSMLGWFGDSIRYPPYPEIKSWALDEKLDDKISRSMLFALSLIEAPQAAKAMISIAKNAKR
jgi:hypothetical protein